jgi:hypothetical protein
MLRGKFLILFASMRESAITCGIVFDAATLAPERQRGKAPMKISFDIDCTPEEARSFFGLPDLKPLHDVYLDRMRSAMTDGITPADWEKMMRAWAPGIAGGFEQWQKLFMAGMTGGATTQPPKG